MPIAFYIVPYVQRPILSTVYYERYLAIADIAEIIRWRECEVRGNRAVVKVNAPDIVLTTLNSLYKRLPVNHLDDTLARLTTAQKNAIRNELLDEGFTAQDLTDNFPNGVGGYTLRQVLIFTARHRRLWRFLNAVFEETIEESDNSNELDVMDRDVQ